MLDSLGGQIKVGFEAFISFLPPILLFLGVIVLITGLVKGVGGGKGSLKYIITGGVLLMIGFTLSNPSGLGGIFNFFLGQPPTPKGYH